MSYLRKHSTAPRTHGVHPPARVTISALIGFVCLLALGACSSVNVDAARKLGAEGLAVATSLQNEQTELKSKLGTASLQLRMADRLTQHPASGPVPRDPEITKLWQEEKARLDASLKNIEDIQAALDAAAKASASLATTYRTFSRLALADYRTETEKEVAGFLKSANTYATEINRLTKSNLSAVKADDAAALSFGAGLLMAEVHKRQIAKASRDIRSGLALFAAAMEREQEYVLALYDNLIRLPEHLLRRHLGYVNAIDETAEKKQILTDMKFVLVKDLKIPKGSRLDDSLTFALKESGIADLKRQQETYAKMIGDLRKLEEKHLSLEAGVQPDPT